MRLGLYLTSMIPDGSVRDLVELARIAEDLGFDDLCMGEHVAMAAEQPTWEGSRRFPHQPAERFPEPLTTFAAIAVATQRVRLVSCILIAPLRPAALLAKTAATVHALSGGRLVLGVSVSWLRQEYGALGVPFEKRGSRLDDTIGACRALWSSSPASFTSKAVSFTNVYCEPRPSHPDDIPFWFGGQFTPRLVRRIVDWGQGFLPHMVAGTSWEDIGEQTRLIKEALSAAGRDPSKLEVGARSSASGRPFARALEEDMDRIAAAGITQPYCPLLGPRTLDEARPALERMARAFEPYRSALTKPSHSS
ncbi:MAG: TIGR03619 family F420-dependent LLM class oxidoreductase [Chloroflexota bacterium]|nr:TIGR03619 family F420-dependent LLM class oxidoreductase [Chloroflexota bacterium]